MDTKELEEAARYSLQCKKASLEELRAMPEETRGKNKEKLIMNRDERQVTGDGGAEELRLESETPRGREARRTVRAETVFRELKMCPETVERLRVNFGLKFRKEGYRYYYNLAEVARAYLEAPTKWKLNRVKDACERYLKKLADDRRYFREWRARRALTERAKGTERKVEELRVESAALPPVDSAEPREVCAGGFQGSGRNAASPLGTEIDVVDMADARCDAMALWAQRGSGRNAASPLGGSTGLQLALQDAQEAEARTREERDALRAKVAELREEIEHLRNDVAWWRGEAKGQELLADALAKENAWLKAKVAVKERTEGEKVEELRVESAALPPVDSAEPREVCAGGFRGSGRNAASPL